MYSFESMIRYSECDHRGELALSGLINYFQDCSTFHSEVLGVGHEYLAKDNLAWVLASWEIEINRFPKLCEKVKIGTFPTSFKGVMGTRNYFMETEDGEMLARANSLWTLVDMKEGKMSIPTKEHVEKYTLEPKFDMDCGGRKITLEEDGTTEESIIVGKQHLDTNMHVNNGQYVDMALSYVENDFRIGQMRAEYKKQALLGDELIPYVVKNEKKCAVSLRNKEGQVYVNVEFLNRN